MNVKNKINELFGIDLRSLALFRISLGILLIIDLLRKVTDLEAHFSDLGIFPRYQLPSFSPFYISIHMLSGETIFQAVLFLIHGIFAIFLLIGYKTRLATIASWFMLVSLHSRNPMVISSADVIFRLMLFWGMFLPLGASFSIDRTLNDQKDKLPERVLSLATFSLLMQPTIIYLFAALHKLKHEEWLNGTAVYYALGLDSYVKPFGLHVLSNFTDYLKPITYSVLYFELIGPILFFIPVFNSLIRLILIPGFFIMQTFFGLCFVVGIFPYVSSIAILPFIPGIFWDKVSCFIPKGQVVKYSQQIYNLLVSKKITPSKINLKPSIPENLIVLFFLIYVCWWNLTPIDPFRFKFPAKIEWVGFVFRLDQIWSMFAPVGTYGYWCVMPGKLKDGSEVDVLTGKESVTFEKPKYPTTIIKNYHWLLFYEGVVNKYAHYGHLIPDLMKYYCYIWNKTHMEDKRLQELEFYVMFEKKVLPGEKSEPPQKVLYSKHSCTE